MVLSSFKKALSLIGLQTKPGPRPAILGKIILNAIRKYDVNWYVHFLKIANAEDEAQGQSVTDAYKQVAWVNIAIDKRSSNIARAKWKLFNGDTEVTSGPVYNLFRDVNPYMSKYQLFEATSSWLDNRGECFWLFEPDMVGTPTQIWIPDPMQMKAKLDSNNQIPLWNYEIKTEVIPYLPDQLIHFKLWNPWNAYRGINPLIAMDTELSQDFLSGISNLNMLTNGSVPEGLLSSEQRIDEAEAEQIKKRWLDKHRGARKSHIISVLGQGVKYQSIQKTPAEMEYFKLKQWSRETILSKHGIPPVLAGLTDSPATLSGDDTKDQLATMWNQALIPRLTFIEQKLETEFFARYKLNLTGKFDLTEIPELQADEAKKREAERLDVTAGISLINEVRERRGEEPVPWGDVAWMPLNLVPVGANGSTQEEPKQITATAIAFLEPAKTPVAFLPEKSKPQYTKLVKEIHWKAVIKSWEVIERAYMKAIKEWMFKQRSELLEILTREKAIGAELLDELTDDAYWATQDAALKRMSRTWFLRAMEESEAHIRELVATIGLPEIEVSWSIFDTRAVQLLDERVTKLKGVTATIKADVTTIMQDAIRDGLSEGDAAKVLRDKYNIFQNRAKTIARTEIGGVLSDSRIETYKSFGWEKHEWLSAKDGKVRVPDANNIYNHEIDGTIVKIGDPFPTNGELRWPHDINGAAGDVISCRCLTVPIVEE